MPITGLHALTMTTPDDPAYENQPQHWNSGHVFTAALVGSEISGAFSNANGLSFGLEAGGALTGSYTAPAQTQFVLSESNGLGWGTNGSTVTGSYSQSTHPHSSLSFANANGVTFGLAGSTLTASVSTNYAGVGETVTTIAGTDLALTVNTDGVSIAYPKWITTARASTDAIGLNTSQTNVTWTVNSSGLSLNAGGYAGTGFTSTTTAGVDAKATNNTAGLSFAMPAYLTTAMASNRGSDFVQATAAFAGTNASGTIASGGISVSVAAPGGGNPASWFDNLGEYIQGSTTLSVQGSTSHIAPFMLPYDISISYLRLMMSASFPGTTTIATTNAGTGSCSIASTIFAVVYVQNVGASSQSLKSTASGSVGFTQRWSLSCNATAGSQWTLSKTMSFQNTTGATSFTTQSVASTSNISLASNDLTVMTGMKALEIPFATSLAAGNYWMMIGISSSSATGGSGTLTRLNMSVSNIGVSQTGLSLGHWGNNTNASVLMYPGLGSFTTNAIGTTASLGYSNISSTVAHNNVWWQFHRTT